MGTLLQLDFSILDFIQNHFRCGFLDALMPFFSAIGNMGVLWLVVAIILFLIKKQRKNGLLVFSGLVAGFILVNLLLKPLVARPRPCWLNPAVPLLIQNPADFSFPSGHTMASFVATFILLKFFPRLGVCALPVAILISFSRLYLYVHFPSDVLFSVLLSAIVTFVIIKIEKHLQKENAFK